jgi:tetratricopeptide (TPR) repeat protein
MGVLAVSVGKIQESLAFFKTALDANPSIGQYWLSYIDALINLDRMIDAKSWLDQAKSKGAKGKGFDKLEQRLNAPNKTSVATDLHNEDQGQMRVNILDRLNLDQAIRLAKKKSKKGSFEDTTSIYKDILARFPKNKSALEGIKSLSSRFIGQMSKVQDPPKGQIQSLINLYQQGQLQQALDIAKQLLSQFPNSVTLYSICGVANRGLGQFDAAITSYKQAIKIKPDLAEAYYNIGNILQDKSDLEAAINSYKKAIKIKPDYAEAYNNIGVLLSDKGDLEASIESYKQAIKIKPYFAEAHRHLSSVTEYEEPTQHVVQMQNLHQDKSITEEQRCHLSFALAKVFEDLNDLDKSFSYLVIGNTLRKNQLDYDIKKDIKLFGLLKNTYPILKNLALQTLEMSSDIKPIFILGMSRSGTSLVEQIVSAHSKITGAGELNYIAQFGASYAEGLTRFNSEALLDFRMRYLGALEKHSNGRSIVTDKMPNNFKYIGLVLSAFPEAKIIHVTRNPAATCWSNYKHYFSTKGLGHCYELKDLVTYYQLYQELMQFWQEQFGSLIYNLNYDNLTLNQEKETRALLQYLGLQWEEGCLYPQNNKRSVRTASQEQVRQQVYHGSSQKWRKFESFIGGAFDSLMEFD